jgi:hypothetical protein
MGVRCGKLKKNKNKIILVLEVDFWPTSARTSGREEVRNEIIRENGYKIQFLMTFGQNY